jgi:trans-aconitate 2-methyltransferase
MPSSAQPSIFSKLHFQSRRDVADSLSSYGLSFIAGRPQPKLLDLGCGCGAVAIAALGKRSDLSAVALDISAHNIEAARTAAAAAKVSDRLVAEWADYVTWRSSAFDLIVSDSVLQWIETGDAQLVGRLAADLVSGGYLVATMPVESPVNSVRTLLRRAWRIMPPALDRLVLLVARKVYPQFSSSFLAERLSYLRIVPVRLVNDPLLAEFERQGLHLIEQAWWPSPSFAKFDHNVLVWNKR